MKKIFLSAASLLAIVLTSCTEKIPLDTGKGGQTLSDTTYLAIPESASLRKILIEEATGVKCPNCPDGAAELRKADTTYPGRLLIIGLHGGSLTSPISGLSKYDFRTTFAVDLFNTYFGGEPNKPAAVFDRTLQGTAYFIEARTKWMDIIKQRLAVAAPLNLYLSSTFDAATNEATIVLKGAYTAAISKKQSYTIVITEDKIIDAQDKGLDVIPDYEHNHVLRDMLTNVTGNALLDNLTTKEAGRVFQKVIKYKLPTGKDWNVGNLNIIAFVHNNETGDKEVQQSVEAKLKP